MAEASADAPRTGPTKPVSPEPVPPDRQTVDGLASDALGLDRLRPGQRRAVMTAAAGRDVLAVMPTGSGKTAIFELAAALLPGVTVVVSPLLALQRDQAERIAGDDVGEAVRASTLRSDVERTAALDGIAAGTAEFLLLAPEQLARDDTMAALRSARPSLFVVDEAHCISSWGHDFRPEYLRLGEVIQSLGHPVVLALTASAAPPVREEIMASLAMRAPLVLVEGFDRPNLHLSVHRVENPDLKHAAALDATAAAAGGDDGGRAGIVYVATRAGAEGLARELGERGVQARAYHGGLGRKARDHIQTAFMDDDVNVIVATTAFGMGIDKPDVRFVFHADVAPSIDDYHQELGRAGRDGRPADVVLWYRPGDLARRRFQTASGDESRRDWERSRAEMMRGYAETRSCRRRFLLSYFGEEHPGRCGRCDNCDAGLSPEPVDLAEESADPSNQWSLVPGRAVQHQAWGRGQVLRVDADTVTVLFDSVGYKTLALDLTRERGLLETLSPDRT